MAQDFAVEHTDVVLPATAHRTPRPGSVTLLRGGRAQCCVSLHAVFQLLHHTVVAVPAATPGWRRRILVDVCGLPEEEALRQLLSRNKLDRYLCAHVVHVRLTSQMLAKTSP